MKEYNRLLDEQEGQRAQELAARMERAWALEERGGFVWKYGIFPMK